MDGAASDLPEGGRLEYGTLPRELDDERVASEGELLQLSELDDLGREDANAVLVECESLEPRQAAERSRDRLDLVVAQHEASQRAQIADLRGDLRELVPAEVQQLQSLHSHAFTNTY